MNREKRGGPRYDLVLPVLIGETRGCTTNIDTRGALVVVPRRFPAGEVVDFIVEITFSESGTPARLSCRGRVRRVHRLRGQWALALEIEAMNIVSETAGTGPAD